MLEVGVIHAEEIARHEYRHQKDDVNATVKETLGFTSTETVQAYYGRGSRGSGILYLTPTRYAVTTRMILH